MHALLTAPKVFRDIAILALLAVATALATAAHALAPRDMSDGVAVVYAPWTDADAAFARTVASGARFVRYGGVPFVAVAMPEDPGFGGHVRGAGAWFLADPRALAACLRRLRLGGPA